MRGVSWLVPLFLLEGCAATVVPSPKSPSEIAWNQPRLPTTVRPLAYRLDLEVVPPHDIKGEVEIDVEVLRPGRVLYLHGRGLKKVEAWIVEKGELTRVVVAQASASVIALVSKVEVSGRLTLRLGFVAPVATREERGAFLRWHNDRYYVFTQFQPTWARRVFPCFDEPGLKTPWEITLRVKPEHDAFANTKSVSERRVEGLKVVSFQRTRPLPAYLVAFAVGHFAPTDQGFTRSGVPVRVIEPLDLRSEGPRPLAILVEAIDRIEAYTGIRYPFEKLDLVVIPRWAGAMENAGLITVGQGQRQPYVYVHEAVHQWFGNLVTNAWWDDIWLHETFATWLAEKIVGSSRYGDRHQILLDDPGAVLSPHYGDDTIEWRATYGKGAAILHMVEGWVGPDRFRVAVRAYLRRHAWKTATTADFLALLPEAAPVLRSALSRPGTPLLEVDLDCSSSPRLTVKQHGDRFSLPVCVRSDAGDLCHVIDQAQGQVQLGAACPTWIALNHGARGHYSAVPGPSLRARGAFGKELSGDERRRLGYDLLRGVKERIVPLGEALALIASVVQPTDRELAATVYRVIDPIVPLDLRQPFDRFLQKAFSHVELDPFSPSDAGLARAIRNPTARSDAAFRYQAWQKGVESGPMGYVVPHVVADGDRALFDRLRAELAAKPGRVALAIALGSFRDPSLAKSALELVGGEIKDDRLVAGLLGGMALTPETRHLARRFLFDRDPRQIHMSLSAMGVLVQTTCDEATLRDAKAWVARVYGEGPVPALEDAERCIALRQYHEGSLRVLLAEWQGTGP